MKSKMMRLIDLELGDVLRRHRFGRVAVSVLPTDAFHLTRSAVLRRFGWRLGRGALLASTPRLLGSGPLHRRLTVGAGVYVNSGAVWDLGAEIELGENVHIGQGVSLLTTTHKTGDATCRAGDLVHAPISVGAGSWIAAGTTVLAGSTIGAGSIVAAGCLVRSDVPANCLFGGVPGRVIRMLDDDIDELATDVVEQLATTA